MPLPRIFRPAAPVDWLSPLIVVSRGLAAVADAVPFPYVGAAFGAGVALLELIQTVGKTSEDLKYLAESVVTIMRLLKEEMESHHGTEDPRFRQVCLEFEAHLTRLSKDLEAMSKNWSSSKFRKYLNSQNVRDRIAQLTRQVDDLRANATVRQPCPEAVQQRLTLSQPLIAALGTRKGVADGFATVESKISELHREINQSTVSTVSTQTLELARYEEDFHALKLGDIRLQFHTARSASFITYNHPAREEKCTAWTDYRATVKGFVHTVRVYEGSDPTESWKGFLSFLADNSPSPHLPQLFGFCSSPRLRSLVFSGELCTLDEYAQTLPTAQAIVDWEFRLLVAIRRLWNSGHSFPLNYALVNPEDQGTMVVSHIGSHEPGSFIRDRYQPFLEWLVTAIPPLSPGITDAKSGTRIGELLSLMPLRRELFPAIPLRSLWATLTARGSVYHRSTRETVAQMFTRAAVPADMWLEVRMRGLRTFDDLSIEHSLRWPTRFDQTRRGFTHFALPLLDNKDRWRSLHDYAIQRGYFLSAQIEFGSAVPEIATAWLVQANSVTSHPALHGCKPTDCCIPTQVMLALTWEMVVVGDDSILAELPATIHVFIRPPILPDGNVEEPEMFWSTHPDTKEQNIPPAGLKIRTGWHVRFAATYWEAHHYEVAQKVQEDAGFDPQTTAAAEFLGLPILNPVYPAKSPSAADENEPPGYPDWYRYSERDPHTMEEYLGVELSLCMGISLLSIE